MRRPRVMVRTYEWSAVVDTYESGACDHRHHRGRNTIIRTLSGNSDALRHVRAVAVRVARHDVEQIRRERLEPDDRVLRLVANVFVPVRLLVERPVPNAIGDRFA